MVWQIFQKSQHKYLGLDIGNTSVKLVYLTVQSNEICMYRVIQSPIRSSEKGAQEDTIQAIRNVMAKAGTSCRRVATALPDVEIFSHALSINAALPDRRTTALLMMAPLVPLPVDTLYFDFQSIQNTENNSSVLGVFCRQSVVHDRQQLIKMSKLQLTALEMESHALARSYQHLHDLTKYPDCWVCVAVHHERFTLLLWNQQHVLDSLSDTIESPGSFEAISTQIYQQLMLLLGTHTLMKLQALWVVGEHLLCKDIQRVVCTALGLKDNPPSFYRAPSGITLSEEEWMPFYVGLGLALRDTR